MSRHFDMGARPRRRDTTAMERIDNGLALEDEAPAWGGQDEYDALMAAQGWTDDRWCVICRDYHDDPCGPLVDNHVSANAA